MHNPEGRYRRHPTKAPLGYFNVRTTDARGREPREFGIDPEGADLVRFVFTPYATGDRPLSRWPRISQPAA